MNKMRISIKRYKLLKKKEPNRNSRTENCNN